MWARCKQRVLLKPPLILCLLRIVFWSFMLSLILFFFLIGHTRRIFKLREYENLWILVFLTLKDTLWTWSWGFCLQLAILFVNSLLNLYFDYFVLCLCLSCFFLRCRSNLLMDIFNTRSFKYELLRCINIIRVDYFHILQTTLQIYKLILALIILIYRF
jgi:hypothetical protein